MIQFNVKVEASQSQDNLRVDIYMTEEEWQALSADEQREVLQNEINENPNQPYWIVENF